MNAMTHLVPLREIDRLLLLLLAVGVLICGLLLPAVAPAPPIGTHDLDGTQARLWSLPFPGGEPAPASLNLADVATRLQREVLPLRIGRADMPYLFLLQVDVPEEHVGKAAVLRVLPAHLAKIVFYLPDGQMVRAGVTQSGEAGLALMPSPWPAARVPLDRPTLEVWVYVDAGGGLYHSVELSSITPAGCCGSARSYAASPRFASSS